MCHISLESSVDTYVGEQEAHVFHMFVEDRRFDLFSGMVFFLLGA